MPPDDPKSLTNRDLWVLLLLQSAVLLAIGAVLSWWTGVAVSMRWPDLRETLLALALVAPLLLSSLVLLRVSDRYGKAVELLERVLGPPMRPWDIPGLALVSAGVEEFFFRGVLQPLLGLWPAAILFGLAHVWSRHLLVHGLWAAAAGLYLGMIYQATGNLSVPIMTHALNNLVGLSLLKRGASTPP
jgi:CAAX protease family protein